MHSLHAYFLRPGRPDADIRFEVLRSKEGRNFHVRSVLAWQREQLVFQLQASFARSEAGVRHQDAMPDAPTAQASPNRDALRGRGNWRDMPIDVRMATEITGDKPLPPDQHIWLKPGGLVPDDPGLHLGLLVYASDRTLLDTAWRPHADNGPLRGASLDHSLWFHEPPRFDDWLLYAMHSPAAAGGRGLAFGAMYRTDGRRVVSVAQEGVLRPGAA
jgi:acyl-CoA thioesterase-2